MLQFTICFSIGVIVPPLSIIEYGAPHWVATTIPCLSTRDLPIEWDNSVAAKFEVIKKWDVPNIMVVAVSLQNTKFWTKASKTAAHVVPGSHGKKD